MPDASKQIAYVDSVCFTNPAMTSLARLLYAAMCGYCDIAGRATVSRDALARDCGMSIRAVSTAIKCAEEAGVITVIRDPGRPYGPNSYQLHDFQGACNPRHEFGPCDNSVDPASPVPFRTPSTEKARRFRNLAARDGWACSYCATPLANPLASDDWNYTETQGDAGLFVNCPDGVHPAGGCRHHGFWTMKSGLRYPVIEHVVPRARGGGNRLENLVLACDPCNIRKGTSLLIELPERWWEAS